MPTNLTTRAAAIEPRTYDAETQSAVALLATEAPIYSTDSATGRPVLEVWRMDGMEPVEQVPLLNTHDRDGVECVLGSVADIRVTGSELIGRIRISATEQDTATKVGEGHIRDVSAGIQPIIVEVIRAGQAAEIGGERYQAPEDSDLRIVLRWRLREVSLCPIGADPRAKIRSYQFLGGSKMDQKMRAYLQRIGLPENASDEDAQAFYESLPELARKRADAYVVEISEEEEESEVESEPAPMAREMKAVEGEDLAETQKSDGAATSNRSRRSSARGERQRVLDIQSLADGVPAELVRSAIELGMSKEQAAMSFLQHERSQRAQAPAPAATQRGFAIHSRSKESDVTAEVLGTALALRSVNGDKLFSAKGGYEIGRSGDCTFRRFAGNSASQDRRSQLLERAERVSHLSLSEIVREACEIDGHKMNRHAPVGDMLRTATSGSALSAIFTTNFNAQFMTGYVDYADSTTEWCHAEDVVNFMSRDVATIGKFGFLQKHSKGQVAQDLDTSDWKESYSISRYSGKFTVDEIDIVNDRFGALDMTAPMDMGLSAAALRPNLVYSEILNNAALDVDGVSLFHADHANYASGGSSALDATSLQGAIQAIAKQRIRNRPLNLRPSYLVVPQDLFFTAQVLIKSEQRIIAAASGGTYNPLLGLLGVVGDSRLGVAGVVDPRTDATVAGSATNWLLVCRPGDQGAKTIMVGYLQGTGRAPKIRSYILDKGQWGMGWDVAFDIGVKALDYRAMYFSAGA